MDARIFMSGKTNVANLPSITCFDQSCVCTFLVANSMWVLKTQYLVVLDQIDHVYVQTLNRLIKLACGLFFRTTINLSHQENLFPVTIPKRLAHSNLTGSLVVVP